MAIQPQWENFTFKIIGGSKSSHILRVSPLSLSNFLHYHAVFGKHYDWHQPLWVGATRLGNPESATENVQLQVQLTLHGEIKFSYLTTRTKNYHAQIDIASQCK